MYTGNQIENMEAECLEAVLAVEGLQREDALRQRQGASPPAHVTKAILQGTHSEKYFL